MKVLKEFFRLKWEEISEFFDEFNEVHAFILIFLYLFGGLFICIYAGLKPINPYFFTIYFLPLWLVMAILIIGIPSAIFYGIIIVPIKWIRSSWKQAKENVKDKEGK